MDGLRLQSAGNPLSSEMMNKATHVWKMLDELAASDPTAYKNYIQKTLQEGKEYMAPPQPYLAIRSNLLSHSRIRTFYLNIFTWQRLPEPEKNEIITKIYSLTPMETTYMKEACIIVNVAVHPAVTKMITPNQLIRSTFDLISSEHQLLVSYEDYQILQDKSVGELKEIQKNFIKPLSKPQNPDGQIEELIENGLSPSLAKQLSTMGIAEKSANSPKQSKKPTVLIEELWTVPHFTEEISNNNTCLTVRVSLPECQSVADCDVSVSPREDIVQVECSKLQIRLTLDMKNRMKPSLSSNCSSQYDIQRITAKFVRKTHQLILTIPIIVEIKNNE